MANELINRLPKFDYLTILTTILGFAEMQLSIIPDGPTEGRCDRHLFSTIQRGI